MNDILIPTMLFWENGNTWYGSKGLLRFFIKPVKQEDAGTTLDIELWRGPLAKEFSEIMDVCTLSGFVKSDAILAKTFTSDIPIFTVNPSLFFIVSFII